MVAVLIVDDHPHLVESLATVVPWRDLGVASVFTAFSGDEALAIVRRERIDVLLTDIRMPGMDGLRLIELSRACRPDIGCILLTGHAEFEYARRAIELRAYRYLMKPVRTSELIASVRELLAERRSLSEEAERLAALRGKLLDECLQGGIGDGETFARRMATCRLSLLEGDRFRLAWVGPFDGSNRADTGRWQAKAAELGARLEAAFGDEARAWVGGASYGDAVVLLSPGAGAGEPDWARLGESLAAAASAALGRPASVFVSREGTLPIDLRAVYRAAYPAAHGTGAYDGAVAFEEASAPPDATVDPLRSLYRTPTLAQLAEDSALPALRDKMAAIFEELHAKWPYSPEHLRETFHHLLSAFTLMAHRRGRLLEAYVGPVAPVEQAGVLVSSKALEAWACNVFEALANELGRGEEGKRDEHRRLIDAVHAYVRREIAGDVTLAAIAAHVYLHPVYLSKVYKETTGDNLSERILTERMEKAKELLRSTPMKIYEICGAVGYRSTQHFITEFKKYAGVTPKQYRDASAVD